MGLSTTTMTNKNVDATQITGLDIKNLFANEKNQITARIDNLIMKKTKIWNLEFIIEDKKNINPEIHHLSEIKDSAHVALIWTPSSRGYMSSPRIRLQSQFPFRLTRAWKYYQSDSKHLVYPERKGELDFIRLISYQSEGAEIDKNEKDGLFRDHREFQNSDSPSRIDWKSSAKHQKHLVRNYEKPGDRKILIDWGMTESLNNFEARISQLSYWISLCHKKSETYCLKIKNYRTEYLSSHDHYQTCMEKLALLSLKDVQ